MWNLGPQGDCNFFKVHFLESEAIIRKRCQTWWKMSPLMVLQCTYRTCATIYSFIRSRSRILTVKIRDERKFLKYKPLLSTSRKVSSLGFQTCGCRFQTSKCFLFWKANSPKVTYDFKKLWARNVITLKICGCSLAQTLTRAMTYMYIRFMKITCSLIP